MTTPETLRQLPAMDTLLGREQVQKLLEKYRREVVVRWLDGAVNSLREDIRHGRSGGEQSREALTQLIEVRLTAKAAEVEAAGIRQVVNATGVIVHTNLGRSSIAIPVLERLDRVLPGYTDLEYDTSTGSRGHRDSALAFLLRELLPCGDATAVNNNAGAVFLILNALAAGGEVIVSRGELVEIGGSFRIPDIMTSSGAVLREVGTTNRTRLSDYEKAITANTRLILQVHRSNFEIVGFTESPAIGDLAAVAHRHRIPLVVDAGSGLLLPPAELFGPAAGIQPSPRSPLADEPVISQVLAAGADLVCFSGDKLLGGPQAGIIAGNAELVAHLRRVPLMRALRLDKLVLSALAETLKAYFRRDTVRVLPTLAMMAATEEELDHRCRRLVQALTEQQPQTAGSIEIQAGSSLIGGGSTPGRQLNARLVVLHPPNGKAAALECFLRRWNPPIIARVEGDAVLLDLRTVLEAEEPILVEGLAQAHTQGLF